MNGVDLRSKPFFLSGEDEAWVRSTLLSMSLGEKIGQLFCPMGPSDDPAVIGRYINELHVGGLRFRSMPGARLQALYRFLQSGSKLPLLLAANLETGGDGIASDGTSYGTQMEVAATGDPGRARELARVGGTEGAALGINWAFGPVVDIDLDWLPAA